MKNSTRNNRFFTIILLAVDFIRSALGGVWQLVRVIGGKGTRPLRPNRFLEILDFLLKTAPTAYWKRPTGIKAGRSIATLLKFIFERETSFDKK